MIKRSVTLLLSILVFALMTCLSMSAGPITLISPAPVNQQFQQTLNSPCIFGDSSCKQPTPFDFTSIAGGGQLQNFGVPTPLSSPIYTGQQIFNAIGSFSFLVGIDVNQAMQFSPTLTYFEEFINGVAVATFGTPGALSGQSLVLTNNGNGFADAIMSGFVAPTANDTVSFKLSYTGANDGTEQFFLVSTTNPPPTVPEPASLGLLGAGLVGVAGAIRRKLLR
jgi:hypothetical protein